MYHKLYNASKMEIIGKFIVLKIFISKQKKINELNMQLKKLLRK